MSFAIKVLNESLNQQDGDKLKEFDPFTMCLFIIAVIDFIVKDGDVIKKKAQELIDWFKNLPLWQRLGLVWKMKKLAVARGDAIGIKTCWTLSYGISSVFAKSSPEEVEKTKKDFSIF